MNIPRLIVIADLGFVGDAGIWLNKIESISKSDRAAEFMVQVRIKDVSERAFAELAKQARDVVRSLCPLLLNGSEKLARDLGYDGVHYTEQQLQFGGSEFGSSELLRTAAVHSVAMAVHAETSEVNAVVYSPVFGSTWKSTAPRGVDALAEVSRATRLPIFALGGIGPDRVWPCIEAGSYGVATVAAVMGATHSASVIDVLLEELNGCEGRR